MQRAGMPAGVLNIVTADAEQSIEVGKVLCSSDVVRHLSFTGSTEVGRILAAQCAPTVKKLALELGGNTSYGTEWFAGLLDDVRVYNRALSASEIALGGLGIDVNNFISNGCWSF